MFAVLIPIYSCSKKDLVELLQDIIAQDIIEKIKIYFVVEERKISFDLKKFCQTELKNYDHIQFEVHMLAGERGLGYALNFGLTKISERFVVRHDLGDRMLPNRLSSVVEAVNDNPHAAVFYSQANLVSGSDIEISKSPGSLEQLKFGFATRNPIIHPTVVLNAEILRHYDLNYNSELRYCEDLDLWLRVLRNKLTFVLIDRPLISYVKPNAVRPQQNWIANLKVRLRNIGTPSIVLSLVGIVIIVAFVLLPGKVKGLIYECK